MNDKSFYYVYRPDGGYGPQKKYLTVDHAITDARKLAEKEKATFIVLKAVCCIKVKVEINEIDYEDDDSLPI